MAVRFLSSETIDGNVKIADEKILALRTSSNDYAIQYRDLDFRFIGSADSSTQRKFSFGYYTSDNPAGTWNGQVYINSYTGSVGIGTTSPAYPLEVQSGGVGTVLRAGTSFVSIDSTGSASAPSLILNGDANTGIWRPAADTLAVSTAGSERMRITSAGYVGIGTITPSVLLELQDSTHTTMKIRSGNSDNILFAQAIQSDEARIGTDTNTAISFFTNTSRRMTITTSGNVGIGTTLPSQKLEVVNAGFAYVRTRSTAGSFTGFDIGQHTGGGIYLNNRDNTAMVFMTNNTERMNILAGGTGTFYNAFSIQGDDKSLIVRNAAGTVIGTMGAESSSTPNIGMTTIRNNGTTTIQFNSNGSSYINGGNLGIGTTSPSTLLSNSSVRNAAASGLSTSLKGLNIEVPAGGNSQGYVASFANTQTASNNYNAGVLIEVGSTDTTTRLLSVESGGTNRFEVRGDGNVGIGTTSPGTKLDVDGTIRLSTSGRIEGRSYPYTTNIGSTANATTTNITAGSSDKSEISLLGGDVGDRIELKTNSTERMRITSGGEIGIGTTFVSAKVQIHSTNAGQPTIPLFIVNENTTVGTEARLGFAANTNNDVGSNRYSYISTINTSGSNGQDMIFATNATGASAVERMRIDSSGDVQFNGNTVISSNTADGSDNAQLIIAGGGTDGDSRGASVHISGNESGNGGLLQLRAGNGSISQIRSYTSGSERMRITSAGELQVTGNGVIRNEHSSGNFSYWQETSTDTRLYGQYSRSLLFGTNATERMRITSAGDINILNATATDSKSIGITNAAGTTGWTFGNGVLSNTHQFVIYDNTAGSARMLIDSSGNVGIGTNSPGHKLDVTHVGADAINVGAGNDFSGIRWTGDSHAFSWRIGGDNFFVYDVTNSAQRLTITDAGNVGIGTTSPVHRLHVEDNGNVVRFYNTGSSNSTLTLRADGADGTDSAIQVSFRDTSDNTVGSITSTGNGTAFNTSSDYRLKENVVEMTDALDRVSQLKPSRFNFIANPDKTYDGFLAHEVQDIVPEAISGDKDEVDEDGNEKYQGIDQSKLVPLLVGAIQELKKEIEILKNK